MRTLFITENIPYPLTNGRNLRVFHLLKAISQVSEVTLVCASRGGDKQSALESLRSLCRDVHFFPAESLGLLQQQKASRRERWFKTLRRHLFQAKPITLNWWRSVEGSRLVASLNPDSFDLVFAGRLFALGLLPATLRTRVVLDVDDLEHQKLKSRILSNVPGANSPFELLEFLKLRRFERKLSLREYQLLVCSESDRRILGAGLNVTVVPNGVDIPQVNPTPNCDSSAPILTYVGNMSYLPNIDAVRFFATHIFPRIRRKVPQAQFWIVGSNPVQEIRNLDNGSSIIVKASVPSVLPYLRQASVAVVPLRSGGGTRLKILEAMANGIPVVSTVIGAQGLEAESGKHLLIEDNPKAFARACLRLMGDEELRRHLASAAYDLVREKYDWKNIERQMQRLVVDGHKTERPPEAMAVSSADLPVAYSGGR